MGFCAFRMKFAACAGLAWFIALGGAAASAEPGQELSRAEAALTAGPGPAILMHLDARRIVDVERAILGPEDPEALMVRLEEEQPVLAALRRAGVNPREALDDVAVAVYARAEEPEIAGVLLGRFPLERLREALSETYESERQSLGDREVLVVTPVDPRSCEARGPVFLHLTPEAIAFGSSRERLSDLLDRLSEAPDSGAEEALAGWRAYRGERVLSLALLAPPAELADSVNDPTARFAMKQAGDEIDPVTGLRAGVALQPDPPALILDVDIRADNAVWPVEKQSAYDEWTARVQRDMAGRLPSLSALQRHMDIEADGTSLIARARIDRTMMEDLARVPAELLAAMFGGMGSGFDSNLQNTGQKRVLEPNQIPQFQGTTSHASLPAFAPEMDQSFHSQTTTGPFGLKLEAIRLNDDGEVEIQVSGTSGPIANMNADNMHRDEDSPRAALTITGVYDKQGNDILPRENCGEETNHDLTALSAAQKTRFVDGEFETYQGVQGSKTLRLAPDTSLADIARIEGKIDLRLATEVTSVRVERPFADAVLEAPELRLAFMQSESGVKYEASGEIDRMLAMLAVDGEGQYLANDSSFSSGRFMGSGKTIGRSYAGRPEALEVIVAVAEETKTYDFTLAPARVRFNEWDYPEPFAVEAAKPRALSERYADWRPEEVCKQEPASSTVAGLLGLCLSQVRPGWSGSVSAQVRLVTPPSDALRRNLSALEFAVSRIDLSQEALELASPASEFIAVDKQQFGDEAPSGFDNGYGDYVNLETGRDDLGSSEIAGLAGEIVVRVPTALAALPVELDRLGREAEGEGFRARFTGFDGGSVLLHLTGPRERLVQFRPYDVQGQLLATNAERLTWDEDQGLWRASFRSSGQPARVDIVVAREQETVAYPFDMPTPE